MWTWLEGKRTYVLAALGVGLSVLAMTEGWISAQEGVAGIWIAGIAAALRAGISSMQQSLGSKL